MQFKRRRDIKRTKIEIIPMIDTMFFLLVFFMLSSLALTRSRGLPVNLPTATTAPREDAGDLTVTIDAQRNVYLDKVPITMQELPDKLLEAAGPGADLSQKQVIINADLTVPHGLVVQTLDECRSVGITRFGIATKPDSNAKE